VPRSRSRSLQPKRPALKMRSGAERALPMSTKGFQTSSLRRRAQGNHGASGLVPPLRGKRFQEPALWAAEWVRRRRSKDFTRLALMPCARESDVDAPASLLQHQYDRSSSRKFPSLRYCANPHCCCSHRRPSLRCAVTALLLRKYVAAEFIGLLRRSPAQYGLTQTRILARASSRDHAPDGGRVMHSAPWT